MSNETPEATPSHGGIGTRFFNAILLDHDFDPSDTLWVN
jgi:hypothetical protein